MRTMSTESGESFLSAWDASSAGHMADGAKVRTRKCSSSLSMEVISFILINIPTSSQAKPTPHILARNILPGHNPTPATHIVRMFQVSPEQSSPCCSLFYDLVQHRPGHSFYIYNFLCVRVSPFQGIFQPRDRTQVSCVAGRFFTTAPRRYNLHTTKFILFFNL